MRWEEAGRKTKQFSPGRFFDWRRVCLEAPQLHSKYRRWKQGYVFISFPPTAAAEEERKEEGGGGGGRKKEEGSGFFGIETELLPPPSPPFFFLLAMILLLLRLAKGLVPLRASLFSMCCVCVVLWRSVPIHKNENGKKEEGGRKRRKCPSHAPFPRAPPALLMPAAAVVVGAAVVVIVAGGVAGSQKEEEEEGKEAIKDSPFSDFF